MPPKRVEQYLFTSHPFEEEQHVLELGPLLYKELKSGLLHVWEGRGVKTPGYLYCKLPHELVFKLRHFPSTGLQELLLHEQEEDDEPHFLHELDELLFLELLHLEKDCSLTVSVLKKSYLFAFLQMLLELEFLRQLELLLDEDQELPHLGEEDEQGFVQLLDEEEQEDEHDLSQQSLNNFINALLNMKPILFTGFSVII